MAEATQRLAVHQDPELLVLTNDLHLKAEQKVLPTDAAVHSLAGVSSILPPAGDEQQSTSYLHVYVNGSVPPSTTVGKTLTTGVASLNICQTLP